jgi:hypothetical protein
VPALPDLNSLSIVLSSQANKEQEKRDRMEEQLFMSVESLCLLYFALEIMSV